MSTDDTLHANVESLAAEATALDLRLASSRLEDSTETCEAFDAWVESFLDLDWMTNRRGEIVELRLLATVGGPHIEAVFDPRTGWATLLGHWGSDSVESRIEVPTLTGWLFDLAECLAA